MAEGEYRFFIKLMEKLKDKPDLVKKVEEIFDWRTSKRDVGWYWGGIGNLSGPGTDAIAVLNSAVGQRRDVQATIHYSSPTGKALYEHGPGGLTKEELKEVMRAARQKYMKYIGSEKGMDLPGETPTFEGKTTPAIYLQNLYAVADSVTFCQWAFPKFYSWYTPDHLGDPEIGSKVFSAVTGIDRTEEELLHLIGDVTWTLQRAIVAREGRRREHDWFSDSFFTQKEWCTKESLSKALDEYYAARGWDVATSIPTRSKLEELDLKDVADDLERKYGVAVP